MNKIDSLIITDTNWERALQIQDYVRTVPGVDAKGVSLLWANQQSGLAIMQKNFRQMINEAMDSSENNMVIMNYFALTKGRILETLLEAERQHQMATRRILVTCLSANKVDRNLGFERPLVHRISYNSDRNDYLENLRAQICREKVVGPARVV